MAIYRAEVTYSCLPVTVETPDGVDADVALLRELDSWVRRHHGRWNCVTAMQEGDAEEQSCCGGHLRATRTDDSWELEVM